MTHCTSGFTGRSSRRRKAGLVALVGALSLASACARVQDALYDRAARQQAAGDRSDWLDDGGLRLVVCGSGTPLPNAERAGPCAAVLAGGQFFLFDVGPGSWKNVQLWRLPRARLSGVLLTHFHSDHIGDLGETITQSWIAGRTAPLPVYGPPGVEDVVEGFQRAYAHDGDYRVAHHTEAYMPRAGSRAEARTIPIPVDPAGSVVLDRDGVRITAFAVDHRPVVPAFGYRVDYLGRSVVISGDTGRSANLILHARDADVIVHEALAAHLLTPVIPRLEALGQRRLAKLAGDVIDYHATPADAAEAAREAHARLLVLTHLVPAPAGFLLRRRFLEGASEAWGGRILLAEDGMSFTLPADATGILEDSLER